MKLAKKITTHRILRIAAAAFIAVVVHPIQAQSKAEKDAAVLKYKGKFLIAKKDGMFVGTLSEGVLCSDPRWHGPVNGINEAGDIQVQETAGCDTEPIHKGESLKILDVRVTKYGYMFVVQNLSPHSITRGIGSFDHQSFERGKAVIGVWAGKSGRDFDAADALTAQWFTLLDRSGPAYAAQLGNTASGIFVKQVTAGMSFAEVESALGVPETRVDLGGKVLYKYKDMTVEFHDGKVTDVR